jgi:hypothetical protein
MPIRKSSLKRIYERKWGKKNSEGEPPVAVLESPEEKSGGSESSTVKASAKGSSKPADTTNPKSKPKAKAKAKPKAKSKDKSKAKAKSKK